MDVSLCWKNPDYSIFFARNLAAIQTYALVRFVHIGVWCAAVRHVCLYAQGACCLAYPWTRATPNSSPCLLMRARDKSSFAMTSPYRSSISYPVMTTTTLLQPLTESFRKTIESDTTWWNMLVCFWCSPPATPKFNYATEGWGLTCPFIRGVVVATRAVVIRRIGQVLHHQSERSMLTDYSRTIQGNPLVLSWMEPRFAGDWFA